MGKLNKTIQTVHFKGLFFYDCTNHKFRPKVKTTVLKEEREDDLQVYVYPLICVYTYLLTHDQECLGGPRWNPP